ncbi:hypothetical protein ACCO45_007570 [Purpureocillium lilacinum]|uniref:Uncharacterized protein n=1 Tax=Purpureocillium lilacinum TaxID=33203 RepID=A0ACC4DVS7_PURLI
MAASVAPLQISSLRIADTAGSAVAFEAFDLPSSNQRLLGPPHPPKTQIPLALRPTENVTSLDTVVSTIEALQRDNTLTKLLARHGTLLFRNLPIRDATDFSKFAHAFAYKPHEIIGIVVDRPLLAPNVAPANEAPKEKGRRDADFIQLELFHRAQAEVPEFIDLLAEKGILSKVTYHVERQYVGGSTLKAAFGKEIRDGDDEETRRKKIEAQITRYGRGEHTTWEWTEDERGKGLVLTHRLPVIRTQSGTNLPTLFTGLAASYKNTLEVQNETGAGRKNAAHQYFGDGTQIPQKYLAHLAKITDEIRVLHKWQEGDVLVYDNVVAQHGREPWEGEQSDRVILASLFDGESVPGAYGFGDWAQVVQASEG